MAKLIRSKSIYHHFLPFKNNNNIVHLFFFDINEKNDNSYMSKTILILYLSLLSKSRKGHYLTYYYCKIEEKKIIKKQGKPNFRCRHAGQTTYLRLKGTKIGMATRSI